MKKAITKYAGLILFSFFLIAIIPGCQSGIEKIADDYCSCLEENQDLSVKDQLEKCKDQLDQLAAWKDDESAIRRKYEVLDSILLDKCSCFSNLMVSLQPRTDWKLLEGEVESKISEEQCLDFKNHNRYYYFEGNGDTTHLKIIDDLWIDSFENGKYHSYLSITWISACEFHIELVETDEPARKALFNPGDIFKYQIIDRTDAYFLMTVTFADINQEFKLYFDR